ncbi:MAG: isoprenoid biosynthesis glyoxalase ElbB [Bradymonadales bacterium]|jgi:enhancing lycopene biosynthesis protein 2
MRVAVILSGCGVRDGSEIHEATSALIQLDMRGHSAECFAPKKAQALVVDHVTGKSSEERRDVLVESARIARGKIAALSELKVANFDAILLPGGFGAATNLCDFAQKGADCTIDADLERILIEAHAAKKVMGFMCISPVIAARVFGKNGVSVSIGDDAQTAATIEKMGAKHVVCAADEAHSDIENKIVTVPAYMTTTSIAKCFAAAGALVSAMETL